MPWRVKNNETGSIGSGRPTGISHLSRSHADTTAGTLSRVPPWSTYLKLAWTLVSLLMTTVHVSAVPGHPPAQPVQAEPGSGVAVSVTEWPPDRYFSSFSVPRGHNGGHPLTCARPEVPT